MVKSHKGLVLFRQWIHIAAILVTAGLAVLNFLNIYLMDADLQDAIAILNAFQFAAKLHEVLIVGSLMLLMMDTVRSRLLTSTGVPLGHLLAPILFNDLDWLISDHFWSSMKPTRSSVGLTTMILLAIPFANIAGPLSAITVVPRPGWSASQPGGIFPTFWNSSASRMWPQALLARDLPDVCFTGAAQQSGCPASAFKNVWIRYDPAFSGSMLCTTAGLHAACNTTLGSSQYRALSLEYDIDSVVTYSTTPTDAIFEAIADRFAGGVASSLDIADTQNINAEKIELIQTQFVGDSAAMKAVTRTSCEDLTYGAIYEMLQKQASDTNWTTPSVQWLGNIDDSEEPSFLFTYLKNDKLLDGAVECDGQDCYSAIRCTSNAKWVPMSIWYNSAQSSLVFQSDPQPQKLFESKTAKTAPSVTIEKPYLDAFNVEGQIDVSNVFVDFMNNWNVPMTGQREPVSKSGIQSGPNPGNYSQAVSMLVSSIITETMSRASRRVGDSLYSGDCNDRKPGFSFAPEICNRSPSEWIHTQGLDDLQRTFSMMTFSVQRSGYGWFLDSLTVQIALGILLFHSLLTSICLVYTLVAHRRITTCWASAPEMLLLAIDSLRAPVLMGSSAKARHKGLWREPVSVMEVDNGDRVSLIVGDPYSYPERLGGSPVLGKKYH